MANVSHPEKAFLQLMARRILRYNTEAVERGEVYHDMSGFSPLQCGARAKFRFEQIPGGHAPVITLKAHPSMSAGELKEIAAEILDGPVKLRASAGDDLEYVRETDPSAPVPG